MYSDVAAAATVSNVSWSVKPVSRRRCRLLTTAMAVLDSAELNTPLLLSLAADSDICCPLLIFFDWEVSRDATRSLLAWLAAAASDNGFTRCLPLSVRPSSHSHVQCDSTFILCDKKDKMQFNICGVKQLFIKCSNVKTQPSSNIQTKFETTNISRPTSFSLL